MPGTERSKLVSTTLPAVSFYGRCVPTRMRLARMRVAQMRVHFRLAISSAVVSLVLAALLLAQAAPGARAQQAQPEPQQATPQTDAPRPGDANGGPRSPRPRSGNADTSAPPQPAPNRAPGANAPIGAAPIAEQRSGDLEQLQRRIARFPLELSRVARAAERLAGDAEGLEGVQNDIQTLIGEIADAITELEPFIPRLEAQIRRLGPEPKNGEPQETEAISQERSNLSDALTQVRDAIKRLELTDERASQLLTRVQSRRRTLMTSNLLQRPATPLYESLALGFGRDGATAVHQVRTVFGAWFSQLRNSGVALILLLIAAALIYVGLLRLREVWLRKVYAEADQSEGDAVSFLKRTRIAAFIAPAFAIPRLAVIALFTMAVISLGLSNWQIEPTLIAIAVALATYSLVSALSRAVLLPQEPRLRLVGVDSDSAARLSMIISALAVIWGADHTAVAAIESLTMPPSVGVAAAVVTNLVFAAFLTLLVNTHVEATEATAGGRLMAKSLRWLRFPAYLAALAVVIASLLGFLTLGRFIVAQVMLVAIGGLAIFLLHRSVASLTPAADEVDGSPAGDGRGFGAVTDRAGPQSWSNTITERRIARLSRWFLNGLIVMIAVPVVLLSWGFSGADLLDWGRRLVFGFEIGEVRISPARIAFAIGLFVALVLLTRLIQRWLQTTVLTARRVDPGIANSVSQFLGYAGFGLAALASASYAGLDFTNLAIVAGALSVGIGFGLQSIVNNFVSGLILLVERPIKVGDWIVVGEHQGYVRRISVRSTEIETFDRASLILPNSELITGTVQNWTHRNTMGRLVIPVGVAYDTDPDRVIALLTQIALDSDHVLRHPPPFVTMEGLGASSLDFALRAYIKNVNNMLSAKTELLVAIVKSFRDAGIEIPYPQQDLHLRDLDGIRSALTKAALERAMRPPEPGTDPVNDTPASPDDPQGTATGTVTDLGSHRAGRPKPRA